MKGDNIDNVAEYCKRIRKLLNILQRSANSVDQQECYETTAKILRYTLKLRFGELTCDEAFRLMNTISFALDGKNWGPDE